MGDPAKESKDSRKERKSSESRSKNGKQTESKDGKSADASAQNATGNDKQPSLLALMSAPAPGRSDAQTTVSAQQAKMKETESPLVRELIAESRATAAKVDQLTDTVMALVQRPSDETNPKERVSAMLDMNEGGVDEEEEPYYEEDDDQENYEEDIYEEGEAKITDKFLGEKMREEPDQLQIVLWENGRKITEEYSEEDWKKLSVKGLVNRWTKHPAAATFAAQKAESQLNDLRFKDRKDREKVYTEIQQAQGAIGALSTNLLLKIQDKCDEMGATIKDFDDPNVDMLNPRDEASQFMKNVKLTLMDTYAKQISDITKVAGATYNRILMMRREQFVQGTGHHKGAKGLLKRLQPSKHFLFGNKVSELCKDLEVSSQLSPLALANGGRGRYNGRFSARGGSNSRGFRGRYLSGGRGAPRRGGGRGARGLRG